MKMLLRVTVLIHVALLVNCVPAGLVKRDNPPPGTVITITSIAALDECLKNTDSKLVILKVETIGCGGCVYIEPGYRQLAQKYASPAIFLTADYQLVPECIWRYNIKKVPTFIIYRNGKILDQFTTTVKEVLEEHIGEAFCNA